MDSRPCWLTWPASASSKCSRVAQWVRLVMFAEPPTASTMHAAITAGRCVRCVRHGSSLAAVCHCVPLSALGAPKARQCRQSIAKRQLCATVLRDSVPLWCSAAPVLRICRSAHSDFIPPCRILQSLSKIIVFCCLFGVSRPRKSYPIFHTRCVAGLLLKMRQDLE